MSRKSKKNKPQFHPPPPPRPPTSRYIWAARLCFAAATALAAWLLFYTLTEKPMAGCAPGSACDRVMGSSWAYWLEVPVTAPALVVYVTLLVTSIAVTSRRAASRQRALMIGTVLSITVLAVAAWFIYLQAGVIKSICKYCTAAHVLVGIGAILFIAKAPHPSPVPGSRTAVWVLLGLLPFATLVAGQKIAPHKINVVSLYRGTLKFDLREAPLIGSPDAKAFVVDLFDYTCPDCQEMHRNLTAARQRLTNSFSIICVPSPLDANCNPRVRSTQAKHKDACDHARVGLAMRRINSQLFEQYQDWFFEQSSTPTIEAAREKAQALAGKAALDNALADPWVGKTLREGVSLYEQNGRDTKNYRIPQLIVGEKINFGPVRNVDELVALLSQNLQKSSAP